MANWGMVRVPQADGQTTLTLLAQRFGSIVLSVDPNVASGLWELRTASYTETQLKAAIAKAVSSGTLTDPSFPAAQETRIA
jgi:hypothetical protein